MENQTVKVYKVVYGEIVEGEDNLDITSATVIARNVQEAITEADQLVDMGDEAKLYVQEVELLFY